MTLDATPSIGRTDVTKGATNKALFIPQPKTVEETGIDLSLLIDLLLKTIYFSGRPTGRQLAEQLSLSYYVIEEITAFLRQEQVIEIVGSSGVGEQAYQYALTNRGTERTEAALGRNHYVGPAPVSFELYIKILEQQSVTEAEIDRETFLDGVSHLVLNRAAVAALGPAANSGSSVLIYGNSGNGKTSIAQAMAGMMPGEVLIPYAVEIHGQIVKVFDPRLHRQVIDPNARRSELGTNGDVGERRPDRRWALSKRPVVSAGGELTLQDLELRYSELSKFYIAPLQWKANNGVLIIDDFGRQLMEPQELLNRWIVPMEERVDHLTLHTGDTVRLPFEVLLIFSTNIPPGKLGDEAFFRRIRHKVEVPNPSREEFETILRTVCEEKKITHTEEGAAYFIKTYYEQSNREFKGCHPRDIVELLIDITQFYDEEPAFTPEWIDLASASYFVETDDAA